jgi:antitoxin (DNA-binding transcriptional repressor) of toxin-antitoxin stability system
MAITPKYIISLRHARAKLIELCDEVRIKGSEKLIAKNGSSCAALIGEDRFNYYHRLEQEHIHLGLLEEAIKGLAKITSRHGR